MNMESFATDKELVAAACNGSEEAFRKLYDKYWSDLYKLASRRLPSEEDVKDILQETFLSLWKNLHHISVDQSVAGYLFITVRNKLFNFYEKNQVQLNRLLKQPFCPVQSE